MYLQTIICMPLIFYELGNVRGGGSICFGQVSCNQAMSARSWATSPIVSDKE